VIATCYASMTFAMIVTSLKTNSLLVLRLNQNVLGRG
jgi:hypothetical protein